MVEREAFVLLDRFFLLLMLLFYWVLALHRASVDTDPGFDYHF